MARKTIVLTNLGRQKGATANLHITDCKVCRHGIYKGQAYAWFRRPLGYSHTACMDREGTR